MNIKHEKEIKSKLIKCKDIKNPNLHFRHLREIGKEMIQNTSFEDLTLFLNAIANKKRFMIMNILKEKDRCVCELEAVLDESQPSISHHLKILESAGLIRGWKKGKFTHYDLLKEKITFYLELLNQKLD
ncbi:MAG: ArsR/SmtB family transcription factor [Candidatus Thorarchaeota archaeon]